MKQVIYTLFYIIFCGTLANGQVNIVLQMDKNPPPTALDWLNNPQPIRLIVVNVTNADIPSVRANVVVTKGGRVVIKSKFNSTPVVTLTRGTKVFLGTDLLDQNSFDISLPDVNLASGTLKVGDYQICVSFLDAQRRPITTSPATSCANFQITQFAEPNLTLPSDNYAFNSSTQAIGTAFRWTPVTPRYNGMVKYRVQIFDMPPRMSTLQALNTAPIGEQDVFVPQFFWINGLPKIQQSTTGKFLWRVFAFDAMTNRAVGSKEGRNKGFSDIGRFEIPVLQKFVEPTLALPADQNGVTAEEVRAGLNFRWYSLNPQYRGAVKYRFRLFEIPAGKTSADALKSTPVLQQDVNATQFVWTKQKAKVLPAATNYVWQVQSLDGVTEQPIGVKKGAEQGFSDVKQFSLAPTAFVEPTLAMPIDKATVTINQATAGINFRWQPLTPQYDGVVTYDFQVFDLPTGRAVADVLRGRPTFSQRVAGTQTTWKRPANATALQYVWRVQSLGDNVPIGSKTGTNRGFSSTRELSIIQDYSEPTLTAPDDKTRILASEAAKKVSFKWNPLTPQYNGVVKYRFYLYEVPIGGTAAQALAGTPLVKQDVDKTETIWQRVLRPTGQTLVEYVWQVQAIDDKGVAIGKKTGTSRGFSENRAFSIIEAYTEPTLATPITKTVINANEAATGVTFRWTPVTPQYSGAVKYRFQLYGVASGTSLTDALTGTPLSQQDITNATEATWKRVLNPTGVTPLRYAWRVQALDNNNNPIGKRTDAKGFSEIGEFNVNEGYSEPTLAFPDVNGTIAPANAAVGIKFKWNPVTPQYSGTVKYRFTLLEIPMGKPAAQAVEILAQDFVNRGECTWKRPATSKGNTYIWYVQALDNKNVAIGSKTGNEKGFSEKRTFTVQKTAAEPVYVALTLASPAAAAALAETAPMNFSWNAPSGFTGQPSYTICLYELTAGQNIQQALQNAPIVEQMTNSTTNFSWANAATFIDNKRTTQPTTLNLAWRVKAVDESGKGIGNTEGWSEARQFTVAVAAKTAPLVERVVLSSPANGASLAETEPMNFSWNAPSGFTGQPRYTICVYEFKTGQPPPQALQSTPIVEQITNSTTNFSWATALAFIESKRETQSKKLNFLWRVKAVDEKGIGIGNTEGWSAQRLFTVSVAAKVAQSGPLTLSLPTKNRQLTDATVKNISFSGQYTGTGNISYRLEVFTKGANQTPEQAVQRTPIYKADNSSFSFNWDGLGAYQRGQGLFDMNYVWRVKAIETTTQTYTAADFSQRTETVQNDKATSEIWQFSAKLNYQLPVPSYPVANAVWDEKKTQQIVFQSSLIAPAYANGVTYRLFLYEIKGNQTAAQALTSTPVWEQESDASSRSLSNFTWTGAAAIVAARKAEQSVTLRYVWRVQTKDKITKKAISIPENTEGWSETSEFSIPVEGTAISYTLGNVENNKIVTDDDVLNKGVLETFSWQAVGPFPGGVNRIFRIYPINAGQTPEQALSNTPIISNERDQGPGSYEYYTNYAERTAFVNTVKNNKLTEQRFVWNVEAIDGNRKRLTISENRVFTIKITNVYELLSLIAPAANSTITYRFNNIFGGGFIDYKPIKFQWSPIKTRPNATAQHTGAVTYTVIIAANTTRYEPISSFDLVDKTELDWDNETVRNNIAYYKFTAASYKWKVTAKANGKNLTEGDWQVFTIARKNETLQPVLTAPIDMDSDNQALEDYQFATTQLKWTPLSSQDIKAENTRYRVQISAEYKGQVLDTIVNSNELIVSNPEELLEKSRLPDNRSALPANLREGFAYLTWKVSAVDATKNNEVLFGGSAVSNSRKIIVKVPPQYEAPKLTSPSNSATLEEDILAITPFKWSAITPQYQKGKVRYRFSLYEIKTNQTDAQALANTPIFEKDVTDATNFTWSEAETTLKSLRGNEPKTFNSIWRVQAFDAANAARIIGKNKGFVQPHRLNIKLRAIRSEPVLMAPLNTTIAESDLPNTPLKWQQVTPQYTKGKVLYRVQLFIAYGGDSPQQADYRTFEANQPIFSQEVVDAGEVKWRDALTKLKDYQGDNPRDFNVKWRVQAVDNANGAITLGDNNRNGYSIAGGFTIGLKGKYTSQQLETPAKDFILTEKALRDGGNKFVFKWKSIEPAFKTLSGEEFQYVFELTDAADKVVVNNTLRGNLQYEWTPDWAVWDKIRQKTASNVNYTWRVRAQSSRASFGVPNAVSAVGANDGWTEKRPLSIALEAYAPHALTTLQNTQTLTEKDLTDAAKTKFEWTAGTPSYVKYRFKVWEIKANGEKVQKDSRDLTTTSTVYRPNQGELDAQRRNEPTTVNYEWNVRVLDNATATDVAIGGNTEGVSETRKFSVSLSAYTPPVAILPTQRSIVPELRANTLRFSWQNVTPTTANLKYRLQIFAQPDTLQLDQTAFGVAANKVLEQDLQQDVSGTSFHIWSTAAANIARFKTATNRSIRFVWRVQALKDGQPFGANNGYTETRRLTLSIFRADVAGNSAPPIILPDGKIIQVQNDTLPVAESPDSFRNKFLKINTFAMLVKESTGDAKGLTGKGAIIVPWLKSPIAVAFENIKINKDSMKVTEGDVLAEVEEEVKELPRLMSFKKATKAATAWTKNSAAGLYQKMKDKPKKAVENLKFEEELKNLAGDNTPKLPLGFRTSKNYSVAMTEMKFTPEGNTLVVVATIPISRGTANDTLSFVANDVPFTTLKPIKPTEGGKLALMNDFYLTDTLKGTDSYRVALVAKNEKKEPETYIEWGEKGFQKLQASLQFTMPKAWMRLASDTSQQVVVNTKLDMEKVSDFIITLDMADCQIAGLTDSKLDIEQLTYDHSDSRNVEGMEFPDDYKGEKSEAFTGFYIKSAKLELPKFFAKGADSKLEVGIENFIITKTGVNGAASVKNIVSIEEGTVGDFSASIDEFNLKIVNSTPTEAELTGQIILPIANGKENALAYEAAWASGEGVQLTIKPQKDIEADFLGGGKMSLSSNSALTMAYKKGKITADVALNGSIGYQKKLKGEIEVDMTMEFQNIGFQYDNKAKRKFSLKKPSFSFASPQKKIAKFPVSISEITFKEEEITEGYVAQASLNFDVNLDLDEKISGKTSLSLIGGIALKNNKFKPEFIKAQVNAIEVKVDLAAVNMEGKVELYRGDETFGDGFKGELKASFKKVGEITAFAQFGSTKYNNNEQVFRYWAVEARAVFPGAGIPLVQPLNLKGAGVGAWYHMTMQDMPKMEAADVANTDNGKSEAKGASEPKSGAKFTPDAKTLFGFSITGIVATTPSDKTFNGDITLAAEFNNNGGINLLRLSGEGVVGAGLDEREKAPIKGSLVAEYDFTQDKFNLSVAVEIRFPIAPAPAMFATPEGKPATLNIDVDGKTNLWSVTVGTPTAPNELLYYSVNTWSYFRAGNNLVPNANFQQVTIDGLRSVDPSINLPAPEPPNDKVKGGNGFDFGIGFNRKGDVSVGPFKGGYDVGAELNLSMLKYGTGTCVGDDFNYWYARGGVAAWATAYISFRKIIGASLGAAAYLNAGAPDPLWIQGRIAGKVEGKILFIKFNFRASVPFTYGTVCKPSPPKVSDDEKSLDEFDVSSLIEIEELAIHKSGAVDRLTPIRVSSYFDLGKEFELENVENGVKTTKTYKVDLKWFVNGGEWTSFLLAEEGDAYSIGTFWYKDGTARNKFAYSTDYNTYVKATLMEKDSSGNWQSVKDKDGKVITKQTATSNFRTHDD